MEGQVFVYVLRSDLDHDLYQGITTDLEARVRKHNAGGVPSTRHRRPLRLVYHEVCESMTMARKREKFFKSGPGHRFVKARMELADASRPKASG
ncbi:MAG: GIY-YIG nuclease family protein [Bacteroidota bacterium]